MTNTTIDMDVHRTVFGGAPVPHRWEWRQSAEVHECRTCGVKSHLWPAYDDDKKSCWPPNYSTDFAQAWRALMEVAGRGERVFMLSRVNDDSYSCAIHRRTPTGDFDLLAHANGGTAAMTICKVAVAVVRRAP